MSPPKASSPLALPPQSGSDDRAHAFPLGTRPAAARQDSSGPSAGRSLIPQKPPTGPRMKTPPTPGSATFYAAGPAESSEQLLAPSRNRAHRFRDDDHAGLPSPAFSGYSSRRTSWSSDQGSRDSRIYGANPFADSRAPSRAGSDDENLNTQTVSEKYNILPSAGLLLFPEDVEKDDYLHNPDPNDKDRDCDLFTRRGFVNMGGLLLITMGVLMLFVGYPVLSFVMKATHRGNPCDHNPDCINLGPIDIMKHVRKGLIDPDTPKSAMTKMSADGTTELKLVFSDEFNVDGRTFYDGDDPYWTAVDIWYGVTQDLEWYDPDAVTTKNGALELRFDAYQNHGLNYRSGMLQSWNQMCFKGGLMEASISLPGRGDTIGYWPGFWSMGNLGRPGYASTTEGLWPYSYGDVCDAGITPNQSQSDGLNLLPGIRLPACSCEGEDHPNPGKSRASPEIDALEGSVSHLDAKNMVGQVSQSCQVAPFDIWWYPDYEYTEIYDPTITSMNSYTGGVYQQAVSGLTNLNNDWYNGKAYQTYSFEYTPGDSGSITWFVGKDKTWKMDARAVRANGNIGQRVIPTEPMAMVLNFGMSASFAQLNYTGLGTTMPATMRFDYVRVYQDPNNNDHHITCDPPDYPTTEYIRNHPAAYYNQNKTRWDQTGYDWPKNALVHDCQAQDSSAKIVRPNQS